MARRPTPVRRLGAHWWVKDESRAGTTYGGNKVRKLGPILQDAVARGARSVVTSGGTGSHHVFATACYARQVGLDTHAVLFPQADHADARWHAAAIVETCASVTRVSKPRDAHATVRRIANERAAVPIAVGGSSVLGTQGWVDGGRELAGQMADGALPVPTRLYVPSGTGGTAVGLAFGLAEAGLPTLVVAVCTTSFLTEGRLRGLVRRTGRHQRVPAPSNLVRLDARHAPVATDVEGLPPFEPTYTGPAWTASRTDAEEQEGPFAFVFTAARL